MHELAIVETLIDQVQRELDEKKAIGRVLRLELSIGRLSGVSCESVRFAFGLLSAGTKVENAEITINEPKAVCRCLACNVRSEIDGLAVRCPKCDSDDIRIEGGRELVLQSIDIEDETS